MDRKTIRIVLLGNGRVGKRLFELAASLKTDVAKAAEIRGLGVIGRTRVLVDCGLGIGADLLRGEAREVAQLFRREAPVLVDASSGDTFDLHLEWLTRGWTVVTANKRPLSDTQERYDELMRAAAGDRCRYWFETTVGAGLPVIRTARELVATGDVRIGFTAALSGTLGFITEHCAGGGKLKHAIVAAQRFGYTESDPREDLSGRDVLRKAMILARLFGWRGEEHSVNFTPFIEPELLEEATWLNRIDAGAAKMIKRLRGNRRISDRYVATCSESGVRVGFLPLERDSRIAGIEGTENMVCFFSDRYASGLTIAGPGAGLDVTAAGLLGDVYRSVGLL